MVVADLERMVVDVAVANSEDNGLVLALSTTSRASMRWWRKVESFYKVCEEVDLKARLLKI